MWITAKAEKHKTVTILVKVDFSSARNTNIQTSVKWLAMTCMRDVVLGAVCFISFNENLTDGCVSTHVFYLTDGCSALVSFKVCRVSFTIQYMSIPVIFLLNRDPVCKDHDFVFMMILLLTVSQILVTGLHGFWLYLWRIQHIAGTMNVITSKV